MWIALQLCSWYTDNAIHCAVNGHAIVACIAQADMSPCQAVAWQRAMLQSAWYLLDCQSSNSDPGSFTHKGLQSKL